MGTETFVLSVLPLTVKAGARFHVSLHIAPRLTPAPGVTEDTLASFPIFRDWGTQARAAALSLLSQAGQIDAALLVQPIDPDLWHKVFPDTTRVVGPRFADYSKRTWRSFPVKQAHDIAASLPLLGALFSPTEQPDLKLLATLPRGQQGPWRGLISLLGPGDGSDDAKLTASLDKGSDTGSPLASASTNVWSAILPPLHAARRFYERPEAQRDYQPEPTHGATTAALTPPEPDFHERVAHLADQPELLRRLGLVIDVQVTATGLAALKAAAWLSTKPGKVLAGLNPILPVTALIHDGERLLTQPKGTDWSHGRLKFGDASKFTALALDADGAALKAERFVRSLPKMLAVADNGDAGDVAPPALRSEGITVIRTGNAAALQAQTTAATQMVTAGAKTPKIHTEDVTRGYRVEIWDDHVKRWFSPHARLATASVNGEVQYTDLAEWGCIQTTALNETPGVNDGPLYCHEALFGWSGWSLSAPRPGPRVEPSSAVQPDGTTRQMEDAKDPPTPATLASPIGPVTVTTKVAPGTLPRLRYGRSYAFRAWSVDIAGNSPGNPVAEAPVTGGPASFSPSVSAAPAPSSAALVAGPPAGVQIDAFRPALGALRTVQPRPFSASLPQFHALASGAIAAKTPDVADLVAGIQTNAASRAVATAGIALTGNAGVDAVALARLQGGIARAPISQAAQPAQLRDALAQLSLEPQRPPRAETLGAMAVKEVAAIGIDPGLIVTTLDQTVTPLVPFRRWDPVPPPVVVARHRFSITESIHHLVIRSGVQTAPDGKGGETTITVPPDAFIAATPDAAEAAFRATSERHLAAPKGSHQLNELHGRFDAAMGPDASQDARKTALAAALRDDGTFFEPKIYSPADPAIMLDQPGIQLAGEPGTVLPAEPLAAVTGPNRGNAPGPGVYVVHDTDAMALPYTPDPLAAGIALGMPGANRGSPLFGAFRIESTAAPFGGEWPAPEPFRLVLESAAEAGARIDGRIVTIGLPPGTRLDLKLSSSLRRDDLPLMAVWSLLPPALTGLELYVRPAADGQFWALTPSQPISLVHAVPRPVLPPLNTVLVAVRTPGDTGAVFAGVIDCHAASTDRVDAEATWEEWVDDLANPGPTREARAAKPFNAQLDPDEDMLLLGADDSTISVPGLGRVRVHRARHEFGDTRHRVIDYAFRATTRFREYFPAEMVAAVEDRSVLGAPTRFSQPSTAAPPAPVVDSVIPLFRWDEASDPGQPFGIRRRRRSGLRIYLKRPWYRTGDGERLGVMLATVGDTNTTHASSWGSDPVWFNAGPASPLVALSLEDLYASTGLDGVRGPDPRLLPPRLVKTREGHLATVLGYTPEYSEARGLWFVDVAIEPAAAMWPFVRLAVARYQPDALAGLELSPIVACDFAQLPPERAMTVSRPDALSARVTVTGPIGLRAALQQSAAVRGGPIPVDPGTAGQPGPYPLGALDPTLAVAGDRRMYARLERRPATSSSDLAWQSVKQIELSIGSKPAVGDFAWTGVLDLPQPIGPAAPGGEGEWRVTVEEREGIEGDPGDPATSGPLVRQWRTIYADRTLL